MRTRTGPVTRTSSFILAFLLLASALELQAQEQGQDLIGEVVRIRHAARVQTSGGTVSGIRTRVGKLLDTRGDTVIIEHSGSNQIERWVFGQSSLLELRVPGSRGKRGAVIGGVAGGLVGLVIAASPFEPKYEERCNTIEPFFTGCVEWGKERTNGADNNVALGTIVGGIAGALTGYVIGRQFETDGWIPVGVPGQLGWEVRVAQIGGGWGPQVQFTF